MEKNKRCFPGWEIVRSIGSGTFGKVYEIKRVDDFGEIEHSAMKWISIPASASEMDGYRDDGYDDQSLAALFRKQAEGIVSEFRLMSKLKGNSNIVSYEDHMVIPHESDPGWDILIRMELLTSLPNYFQQIQAEGMVEEAVVIKLGVDICKALELCGKHQIIHRDIKPQNILISPNGDFKLGDFGIARTLDHTTKATRTGTYGYMAPEVYKTEAYNGSADICSLGLVMYWMLNERRGPFQVLPPEIPGPSQTMEALARQMSGAVLPRPLHGSDALCEVVLKACAYDPDDRFASPAGMRAALEKLGKPAVIPAVEVPPAEEAQEADAGPFARKEEPEQTVGPLAAVEPGTADWEDKTQAARPAQREPKAKQTESPTRPGIRKRTGIALGVVAAAAVLLSLGTALRQNSAPAEAGPPVLAENQTEWSEWTTELPEGVDDATYEVETRTVYRSREQESTTSTRFPFLLGWEKVAQTRGDGDYGPWSQWTAIPVREQEGREIETQTQYRSRDLETSQSDSGTMEGWELSEITYTPGTEYQSWTGWTSQAPSKEAGRQIETKVQYRYRNRETTTSTNASMAGWTCYDTKKSYGEWSEWVKYGNGPFYYENDYGLGHGSDHEVESKYVVVGKSYTMWCCSYGYGTDETLRGFTSLGGGYYLKTTGEACPGCGQRNRFTLKTTDVSEGYFRHRFVTTTYYYERYGAWSKWSESAVTETASRDVETSTTYRCRDLEQIPTYHFQRWGAWTNWSAQAVESTETCQVQEKYAYRYRDVSTEPTYYFVRWGEWSEYTAEPLSETETCQVETREQYRYRLKPEAGETASAVYQQNQFL